MPFIRRKIALKADAAFAGRTHEHEHYVKPTQVQKGDVIIHPDEMPDALLADLAHTHPKEFRKAALERGLVVLEEEDPELEDENGEEDEDEEEWTPRQLKFLEANADQAVKLIEAAAKAEDVDAIAEYAIAEESREKPRRTVLEALQKAVG